MMVARNACAPALPNAGSQGFTGSIRPRPRSGNDHTAVNHSTAQPTACVAQESGVGKFSVAALVFGNPSQPRSKHAVGAYYVCAAELPVASGRLRETARHRARKARLTLTGRLSAACLPLLLAACATPTVTRSCLTQAQYEQLKASEPPKVHDKLTGKADEDVRPLAGSALELRAWGHAMLDTLKICSTP